jgi:MarR family transcriptional regulator for hemolysin
MKVKLFPLDESPFFWIYRTHVRGVNFFRRVLQTAGYDLTPEQCGVLVRLQELEGTNQAQMGERLLKDRHNMTRILNVLEKRGLIVRRADSRDRRAWRIYLTKEGKTLQQELITFIDIHLQQMFEGLSTDEIKGMQRVLRNIVTNIERKEL